MSNVTFFQRAVLGIYSGSVVEEKQLTEGEPFTLEYKPTKSVPPPIFSWSITDDRFGKSQTNVVTDKRVQIDEEGKQSSASLYVLDTSMMNVRYEQQLALSSIGFVYELHTYYDRCTSRDVMELFRIKCEFHLMNPCRCKCGFE